MTDTHMDHVAYAAKCRKMSNEQLEHVIFDCREVLNANPNGHKAGYYCDEISYCSMELMARAKKQRTATAGLTPKGAKMPTTQEEFHYLAGLYETALLREKDINSKLRTQVHQLTQRVNKQ